MSLPYERKLIPYAKKLRKNSTPQENHLWYDYLRTYPVRFQRQKTIRSFIADFYCHKAKLVIELDGAQHDTQASKEYDLSRSAVFDHYGIKVIRFKNHEVDDDFKQVCNIIDFEVNKRVREHSS